VFLTWLTVDYFVNFIPRFHGRWTGETEDVHGYLPLGFVATIFWLCALSLLLVYARIARAGRLWLTRCVCFSPFSSARAASASW
jgi:hypothetical protein